MITLEVELFADPYPSFGTGDDTKPASFTTLFIDSDKTLFQRPFSHFLSQNFSIYGFFPTLSMVFLAWRDLVGATINGRKTEKALASMLHEADGGSLV